MGSPDGSRPHRPWVRGALRSLGVVVVVVAVVVAVLVARWMDAGPWFPSGGDGSMVTGAAAPRATVAVAPAWQSDRRE
ncbi:hypothetical protein [Knoellia sp. LjRoot47]|uniref:hypothetical protein n=1 Tax=Knoellia sp. LjRoot47 TaxID=3342330 RepID=UPI003ECCD3B6